ncbi:hypothetical protein BBP40_009502 [Aspergillus hancockii]|nr:hypothetical protein BBP40_009502 [Aspergillus hancockii]
MSFVSDETVFCNVSGAENELLGIDDWGMAIQSLQQALSHTENLLRVGTPLTVKCWTFSKVGPTADDYDLFRLKQRLHFSVLSSCNRITAGYIDITISDPAHCTESTSDILPRLLIRKRLQAPSHEQNHESSQA